MRHRPANNRHNRPAPLATRPINTANTASPLLPDLPFRDQYARTRELPAVHFRPKPSTNLDIQPACHGLRGRGR
jgi:hypothetical protein